MPIILVKAHEDLSGYVPVNPRRNYWLQPSVWPDVKSAYDKMLALHPEDKSWHHNYALFAYKCEQWDELNKQIPLLGNINYSFFGGKEEWDKIVAQARPHATNCAALRGTTRRRTTSR